MILNLSQDSATAEQLQAGVVDLPEAERQRLEEAMTFEDLPTRVQIQEACDTIASIAVRLNAYTAMIGGDPWMMSTLEQTLAQVGVRPLYAFSVKESVESVQPDGSVRKTEVLRHLGFVEAFV